MTSKVAPYFDEIVALVAGGRTIQEALASKPEYPSRVTFKSYAHNDRFPERRQQLNAAQAAGKASPGKTYRFSYYTEEQYERSLAIIRDNFPTAMAKLRFEDCPGYTGMYMRASVDPEFAERFAAAREGRSRSLPIYSDSDIMEAVVVLKQKGITAYMAEKPDDFPRYETLLRRSHHDPGLARIFANAVETIWIKRRRDTEIRKRNRSLQRKRADTPIGERLKTSLLADDLYSRVNRAVAASLDRDHREDIVSSIIEAVLTGEIPRDQIESRAREFTTSHFRSFSSLKEVSLDAHVYGEHDLALIDSVSTSDWTFEGAI